MSNIHGLNDYGSQDGRSQRQRQITREDNNSASMLGISNEDLRIMGVQLANNRIPFINIMIDNVQPLQQSIPYTLRLVWCPAFSFLSFSNFLLITIWVMYIVCLSQGIYTAYYNVLQPTPQTLRKFGAFNYQLLKDGEVWRLITAAFINSDLLQMTMSTLTILFFITQLQQCYNPLIISIFLISSAISGNITTAVFNDKTSLVLGTGCMVYGTLGGFLSYLTINWQTLFLIRKQLAMIMGIIIFIAMIFSIGGFYGFACFMGSILGGYLTGLALFPAIKDKKFYFLIAGIAGLFIYWLTMFLIFYLAI